MVSVEKLYTVIHSHLRKTCYMIIKGYRFVFKRDKNLKTEVSDHHWVIDYTINYTIPSISNFLVKANTVGLQIFRQISCSNCLIPSSVKSWKKVRELALICITKFGFAFFFFYNKITSISLNSAWLDNKATFLITGLCLLWIRNCISYWWQVPKFSMVNLLFKVDLFFFFLREVSKSVPHNTAL